MLKKFDEPLPRPRVLPVQLRQSMAEVGRPPEMITTKEDFLQTDVHGPRGRLRTSGDLFAACGTTSSDALHST